MSNAFGHRSHVYTLSAVASAFLFQPLAFIDSIFCIIGANLMIFSVEDCVCCEKKLMCYDILTERRAGVLCFKNPS